MSGTLLRRWNAHAVKLSRRFMSRPVVAVHRWTARRFHASSAKIHSKYRFPIGLFVDHSQGRFANGAPSFWPKGKKPLTDKRAYQKSSKPVNHNRCNGSEPIEQGLNVKPNTSYFSSAVLTTGLDFSSNKRFISRISSTSFFGSCSFAASLQ
jgi:hypothetical protein